MDVEKFAARYAEWIDARLRLVLIAAFLLTVGAALLVVRLPVQADFGNLLPPSARSVRNLEDLEQRARAFGFIFVQVESDDPGVRSDAAKELYEHFRKIDPLLLSNVTFTSTAKQRFVWDNRFLFVDLNDLRDAKDALEDKIQAEKLKANPLYISLEDEDEQVEDTRLSSLRTRLEDAKAKAEASGELVSHDGKDQLIILRSSFPASQAVPAKKLVEAVVEGLNVVKARYGDDVRMGMSGNVYTGLLEQRSILEGMLLAASITVVLVWLGLLLYYRSFWAVMSVLWALMVGSMITFGLTKIFVGHLNLATAFLASIVIGNGINPNIILLARYFEELRRGQKGVPALAGALSGAFRGTLAASTAAAVAYGSLVVTNFRGFRHFGIIGGMGMVICWITAFSVLPAALSMLSRRAALKVHKEPAISAALAGLFPKRSWLVALGGLVFALASGSITWR